MISQTTVMAEAFAKAGLVDPGMRLRQIVRDAVEKSGGRIDGAFDAMAKALAKEDDAALERELCSAYRGRAMRELLGAVFAEMRRQGERLSATQASPKASDEAEKTSQAAGVGKHYERMELATPPRSTNRDGVGHYVTDGHFKAAHAGATPHRPNLVALASAANIVSRSILDSIHIDGLPLRKVKAGRALEWAEAAHKRARLVRVLAEGIPSESCIGDFHSDEAAERLRAIAEAPDA